MKGGNEATRKISREVRKVREVLKIALRSLRSLRLKYFDGLTSAIQIDYWLRKRFSAERSDFVRRSGECVIPFVSRILLPPSNKRLNRGYLRGFGQGGVLGAQRST